MSDCSSRSIPDGRRVLVGALCAGLLLASVSASAQVPVQRDTRLIEAERALARGDGAQALKLGTAYVKAHPRDAAGRLLLARVHAERDELDQAYEEGDFALRAAPRNIEVLALMGFVSGQLAAAAFERLAAEAPG